MGGSLRAPYQAPFPAGSRLAEESSRNTGAAQDAANLTRSYASLLTASFARAEGSEG